MKLSEDISLKTIDKLVEIIQDIKLGLDPDVLDNWYRIIEAEARTLAPPDLAGTIQVTRDEILPLKFRLRASKRVVPHVLEAIENHLPEMPFATRLYFQKLEEIVTQELLTTQP